MTLTGTLAHAPIKQNDRKRLQREDTGSELQQRPSKFRRLQEDQDVAVSAPISTELKLFHNMIVPKSLTYRARKITTSSAAEQPLVIPADVDMRLRRAKLQKALCRRRRSKQAMIEDGSESEEVARVGKTLDDCNGEVITPATAVQAEEVQSDRSKASKTACGGLNADDSAPVHKNSVVGENTLVNDGLQHLAADRTSAEDEKEGTAEGVGSTCDEGQMDEAIRDEVALQEVQTENVGPPKADSSDTALEGSGAGIVSGKIDCSKKPQLGCGTSATASDDSAVADDVISSSPHDGLDGRRILRSETRAGRASSLGNVDEAVDGVTSFSRPTRHQHWQPAQQETSRVEGPSRAPKRHAPGHQGGAGDKRESQRCKTCHAVQRRRIARPLWQGPSSTPRPRSGATEPQIGRQPCVWNAGPGIVDEIPFRRFQDRDALTQVVFNDGHAVWQLLTGAMAKQVLRDHGSASHRNVLRSIMNATTSSPKDDHKVSASDISILRVAETSNQRNRLLLVSVTTAGRNARMMCGMWSTLGRMIGPKSGLDTKLLEWYHVHKNKVE